MIIDANLSTDKILLSWMQHLSNIFHREPVIYQKIIIMKPVNYQIIIILNMSICHHQLVQYIFALNLKSRRNAGKNDYDN